MTNTIAYILTVAMSVTLILLAVESETVLQWFGYLFGAILAAAVIRQIFTREDDDA